MREPVLKPSRVRLERDVADLLRGTTNREPWKTADSLSGSGLERARLDDEPVVVKYLCVDDDWIMRGTGDLHCRQLALFASPVLDALPRPIDHAVVAMAPFISERGHRGAALLMRDAGDAMVPAGSDPIPPAMHRRFLDHMAQMHAAYLGFEDTVGLFPWPHHYVFLTPTMAAIEKSSGGVDPVPQAVDSGWRAMLARHPGEARTLLALAADPSPLLELLGVGPQTLLHGDWKLGNLGSGAGGDTILLDWDRTGQGPVLIDFAWYLAVNCDRLPESKEATIGAYRAALEAAGVDTTTWWDAQLAAALAGAFLQLGWSKTGDPAEFAWWSDRLHEALPLR